MKQIQITWSTPTNQYKSISTVIDVESVKDFNTNQKEYITKAKIRVMSKRYWSSEDMKRYGYTVMKARVYDKEKIKQENVERYERIKEEHYADGSWKRPKGE